MADVATPKEPPPPNYEMTSAENDGVDHPRRHFYVLASVGALLAAAIIVLEVDTLSFWVTGFY